MDGFSIQRGGETLVLNCDGQPLSVFPVSTLGWREAISNVIAGDVDVLETYDDWVVRSQNISFPVPAVVMTHNWVPKGRVVRFSSSNVFLRDNHTCQYCNKKFNHDELTKEHVIPRVLGGKVCWENIVAACGPCNQLKGQRLEMKPTRAPRKPTYGEMVAKIKQYPIVVRHSSWNNYLNWPEEQVRLHPPKNKF